MTARAGEIELEVGVLAESHAAALLNPVDAEQGAATPAARRVQLLAGPAAEAQLAALGELPVGSATITSGGELPAQFLIHVVVRSREDGVTRGGVRRALQNALRRTVEWGIPEIATPPLGTGAGNLDAEESAAVMVPVLREHLRTSPYPSRVRIVVESEYELESFRHELARTTEPAPESD